MAAPPALASAEKQVEVLHTDCYLLRNALSPDEQAELFAYIQSRDRTEAYDTAPRAMCPSPKTLLFGRDEEGCNIPHLTFDLREESPVERMIAKATAAVEEQCEDRADYHGHHGAAAGQDVLRTGRPVLPTFGPSITMAVIQYVCEQANSRFPPHIDHCDNSYVYLTSLGCTANFMVKGPAMESRNVFKFRSGDMLIFNASTAAGILHGVEGIDGGESCPGALASRFPATQRHRYGVQCRVRF